MFNYICAHIRLFVSGYVHRPVDPAHRYRRLQNYRGNPLELPTRRCRERPRSHERENPHRSNSAHRSDCNNLLTDTYSL